MPVAEIETTSREGRGLAWRRGRRWAACRTEVLAGCTHALMAQRPRRLAELIGDFLAARE